MSFLLDTNICSAHLKRPAGLMHRFTQHSGRLYIATVALGELYAWAYRRPDPTSLLDKIENDLLRDVLVLDYDAVSAKEFGRLRGSMLGQGLVVSRLDLMIGAVALVHDHNLVTHNTADFQNIPGLRLEDWLA
jgi:tRNA(fMet)-specific endonuclease VapC